MASRKRTGGEGWLTTVVGLFVLVVGGFCLGLLFGIVSEEPELVVGHVAGRSTEVDWSAVERAEPGVDVAAAAPPQTARGSEDEVEEVIAPEAAEGAVVRESLPAVSAPAPQERNPSPRGQSYLIQVGAFGIEDSAERLAKSLRKAGYPVRVLAPTDDDRWRVRVGPPHSEDDAERTARRLKTQENLPTWVLRDRGA